MVRTEMVRTERNCIIDNVKSLSHWKSGVIQQLVDMTPQQLITNGKPIHPPLIANRSLHDLKIICL
jgi:hypothetical protein